VRVPVRLLVLENRAVVSIRFLVPLSVEALAIRSAPLVLLARMLLLSVTLVALLNNTPPPVLPLKVLLTSENEAEPVSFTAPPLKGTVLPLKVLLVMTVGWKLKTAPPAEDEVLPLKVLVRTVSPATPLVEMAPPSPVAVLSTRAQFTTVSVPWTRTAPPPSTVVSRPLARVRSWRVTVRPAATLNRRYWPPVSRRTVSRLAP